MSSSSSSSLGVGIVPVPEDILALSFPVEFTRRAPKLQCSNITCTFKLTANRAAKRVCVGELSRRLPGVTYDPKRFAACTLRSERATVLIFDGGSAVCVGTTSENQARLAAMRVTTFLLRTGELVCFRDFAVQNVVCRASAGFLVDIAAIDKAYRIEASYDSGTFPGLVFRIKEPKVVIIVFVSGYCIVTGSKAFAHCEVVWTWFYTSILQRFRLEASACPTSSAYRMAQISDTNTVAEDCDALWNAYVAEHGTKDDTINLRYVTNKDDELARNAYAEAVLQATNASLPSLSNKPQ